MRTNTFLRAGAPLLLLGLGSCGGGSNGSPQSPGPAATPPARSLAAGTTLTVLSGEDQAPVAGARVTVSGQEYATDGAGQVVLGAEAAYGSFVDILADGFLDRQTVVPSSGATRFVLWPRETATGMNESFTAQLVYTYAWSGAPEHGSSPLERIREDRNEVYVFASADILGDPEAARAHEDAVAAMNAALEGRATYILTSTLPNSGIVFRVHMGGDDDEGCAESNTLGYFSSMSNPQGEITGGEIVYCSLEVARSSTPIHELGHSVGLQHTYETDEIMNKYRTRYRRTSFTEREALAMRLLFDRHAGNRFPDSDRGVAGTSAAGVRTTVCRGTPEPGWSRPVP